MITINGKIANINTKETFVQYSPAVIQLANLKGWYKLESLNDVVLNFQNQTGTVSTTSGLLTVTGSGTSFSQNDVGKRIRINAEEKWIVSVASTTSLTVDTVFSNTNASIAYAYGYVSKWKNSVTGMPDFDQSTTTAQPLIKIVNSKILIHFNSNRDTDFLSTSVTYSLGFKQTYLFKGINNKTTNSSDIFNGDSGSELPRITIVNTTKEVQGYNKATVVPNYMSSLGKISDNISCCIINKGNGWEIYNQNNINITVNNNQGTPTNNVVFNRTYFIGNYTVAGVVTSFKGYFSELIIYNEILTQSERGQLLHYLNSKKQ